MLSGRQSPHCGTIAALLALNSSSTGRHYVDAYLSPALRKVFRCISAIFGWVAVTREFGFTNICRGLLWMTLSAIAVALSVTSFSFGRAMINKIEEVVKSTGRVTRGPFRKEELRSLPKPVQRYFNYAISDGQPAIDFCALKQTGLFRLRTNVGLKYTQNWKQVSAQEYFSVNKPGYVWVATIQLAPLCWIRGWDSYVRGRGHMLWKLLSSMPMVDFAGPDIDRAALSRYLTEAVYFPTALLPSDNLSWETIDDHTARATLTYNSLTASAVFHFNDLGQITKLQSMDRPRRLEDGTADEDQWTGYYWNYKCVDGIHVPHTMEAVWNLISGDFPYAMMHLTDYKKWCDVQAKNYLL